MKCKLNINDLIKVRLTDLGYEILTNNHNSYVNTISNWKELDINFFKKKADKDGYYTIQLHELMNVFGKHLTNGAPQYFINNNIIIN